ncbi:peptidyl-prolyl cis-trans isomerase FKBP8-like [Acanthaster planci]|uniref:peptidylprolyl isomerase n=1 Tax=Acanthaster planci TaxID=133434 RepID=A0A8B7ZNY5_ACAPL|nr:peptidyl-prolyl cis-trans isomerase FKBP8-like [Acanthaster planci]XP_022106770.1 peptidyl-prolyl cis-trans isomerase FKBP8-like [Acanthaster planci]XP_022106771.1 peptidyl-prolyl cis-trans isomerase FKBP8-like [Acanthaster planci]XP_022106772.1 peptidyl-prolyl cis-trans isomerase FKBP8-like [Acanthaster planci]XP_022106773.1 peptidyl-prolyl cis-trans isomerase FKBP8-like [Acanthaster planci]
MDAEEIKPHPEAGDHGGGTNEAKKAAVDDTNPKDAVINACNGSVDHGADAEDEGDDSDMPPLIDSYPSEPMSTAVTNGDKAPDEASPTTETKDGEPPEWMDVIGNGQLMKKILREGQGAASRPQRGEMVTLKSKGLLEDGTEVDCHEAISFVLGEGDVVSAWDLCLSLMDLGEVSIIKTSPRFAYGETGRAPDVPPNAEVTYELELLNVQPAPDLEEMTVEEVCSTGDKKRERGNELFSRKDYSGAINSYSKALKLLEKAKVSDDNGSKQAVMELRVKCYNNLAAAQLKIDAYEAALKSCNNALEAEPENVKALFRKGKVLASQGDYEQAVKTMKEALSREPSNKVIHHELSRLTNRETKERHSEKQLYQRMVSDMASVTKITPRRRMNKWLFLGLTIGVVILAVLAALATQQFQPES